MNNNESIAYNKATNPNRKEMDKAKDILSNTFNFYGKGTMWGVQAGALMGLFIIGLQLFGGENIIALKFFKYAFLIIFLGIGLNTYKSYLHKDTIFKNGALLGGYITFISGIVLIIVNTIAFTSGSSITFEKFGVEANNFGQFLTISGTMFFEVIVFGMIITFIILQYLKSTFKPNEGLQ